MIKILRFSDAWVFYVEVDGIWYCFDEMIHVHLPDSIWQVKQIKKDVPWHKTLESTAEQSKQTQDFLQHSSPLEFLMITQLDVYEEVERIRTLSKLKDARLRDLGVQRV
jgi:hypothetical protein